MRVLILTVTAGQGHHAAGKSVSDALTERGAEVMTIDVFKEISLLLYGGINQGYLLSTKYAPAAYRRFYRLFENKGQAGEHSVSTLINMAISNKFEQNITEFDPDFIVCTHVFTAQVVNELKRHYKFMHIPTLGIVTDYTVHPFWEDVPYIEYIDLASDLLTHRAVARGIDLSRIVSLGIPVQKKFSKKMPQSEARKLLGLSEDKPVILPMGGSMGYGNMSSLVERIEALDLDVNLLVVCGRNTRQKRHLDNLPPNENRKVFGFVDNVDVMMDAADCIVTKPGGLTTSEAMAKKLPMILVNPIPGHEERNTDFFVNNGIALAVDKNFTIDDAIYFLFNCEGRLKSIAERLDVIAHPNASADIAEFILSHQKR